ncbi:MAG: hypothetical protein AB7N65_12950 [Vicinamibacterales bacterium]
MSWRQLLGPIRCTSCDREIPTGELARFGERAPVIHCRTCAARAGLDGPPPALTAATAAAAPAGEPQRTLFEDLDLGRFRTHGARMALDHLRARMSTGASRDPQRWRVRPGSLPDPGVAR